MADAGTPVSQTAVWKIENGNPRRTISVDEALALAKVFEVDSIEDLTRPPTELVTAGLRQFAADLDSVGTDLLTQRTRLTEIAHDTAQIRSDLLALFQFSGEPLEVEDLQRAIADMQKTLAEIGDELRNLVAVTRSGWRGRSWGGASAPELLGGDGTDGKH
jgi:hypothetical protein